MKHPLERGKMNQYECVILIVSEIFAVIGLLWSLEAIYKIYCLHRERKDFLNALPDRINVHKEFIYNLKKDLNLTNTHINELLIRIKKLENKNVKGKK